jgi:hypothetical protein
MLHLLAGKIFNIHGCYRAGQRAPEMLYYGARWLIEIVSPPTQYLSAALWLFLPLLVGLYFFLSDCLFLL